MSTIFHIMKEEYDRLVKAEKAYRRRIRQMPQGAPRVKHISGRDYLYLARRKGPKVVYDYIGSAGSKQAVEILEKVKKRRQYASLLQDIRPNLRDVKKVLRGKI
jgi:hypothetical protein